MATTLVVDGYNAINASKEGRAALERGLKQARDYIVRVSKEYARSSGYITDVKVVFDGDDQYRYLDKMKVSRKEQIFSDTGKGDDTIIATVRSCSEYSKVIIVSNDNYVRNWSRGYASVIGCDELFKKKKRRGLKGGNASSKDINKGLETRITEDYRKELGIE